MNFWIYVGINCVKELPFSCRLLNSDSYNMGSVHSASLNQAIVVSGGCTSGERRMVVGGWTWAWWLISDVQVFTYKKYIENNKMYRNVFKMKQ